MSGKALHTNKKSLITLPKQLLAALSVAAVAAVAITAPLSAESSAYADVVPLRQGEVLNQRLMAQATAAVNFALPSLKVSALPKPVVAAGWAAAPPAPAPSPGSVQAIARGYVGDDAEFSCLVALWNRESRWNPYALNRSSGAYGIPQSLPGHKMASAGADWRTNPDTQIRWGLGYIKGRYGSPCAAWAHSQAVGWY